VLFDMPAGVGRVALGRQVGDGLGTIMVGVVAVGSAFSSSVLVLGAAVGADGRRLVRFWQLARLAYVSEVAPCQTNEAARSRWSADPTASATSWGR